MSWRIGNIMPDKLHVTCIFEPYEALRLRFRPDIKGTYNKKIKVAIEIYIHRPCIISPRKVADPVVFEINTAFVFKPLNSMPWSALGWNIVKGITVCIEDIFLSILVEICYEICHLNQNLRCLNPRAVLEKSYHYLHLQNNISLPTPGSQVK